MLASCIAQGLWAAHRVAALILLLRHRHLDQLRISPWSEFPGQSDLDPERRDMRFAGLRNLHYIRHVSIAWKAMHSMPESLLLRASPLLRIRSEWQANDRKIAPMPLFLVVKTWNTTQYFSPCYKMTSTHRRRRSKGCGDRDKRCPVLEWKLCPTL